VQGNFLVVPDEEKFESRMPFAVLVSRKHDIHHKIGLVELEENYREKLEKIGEVNNEAIVID